MVIAGWNLPSDDGTWYDAVVEYLRIANPDHLPARTQDWAADFGAQAGFTGLLEISARHEQPIERAAFRRLLGTHSAINVLPSARRTELLDQSLAVADAHGAFDGEGRGAIAWRCDLFVCAMQAQQLDYACHGNSVANTAIRSSLCCPHARSTWSIGAGLHGLSTAYHLGTELAARGKGSGADIVILEKSHPGAGASGIACGVVRNNYFQPAMQELMQACVEVWESDPAAYSYNPVGYMAIGPQAQEADLTAVYERQQKIGYDSTFVTGEAACDTYMKKLFPDWRAKGVTAVLHEHKGGFAHNLDSVAGMQAKAESTGAQADHGRRGDRLRVRERRLGARRARRTRAASSSTS